LDTTSATDEMFEPRCAYVVASASRTVWYRFTPETTQFIRADTAGSDFDTALAVYSGTSADSLESLACSDDVDGLQARVDVTLEAGTTYYFQVGGFSGDTGSLVFNLKALPGPPPSMANVMAVDAVPGGELDASRTVQGTTSFYVNVVAAEAPSPYQAYQYRLRWDADVLAFESVVDVRPADLILCARPVTLTENTVYASCTRVSGTTQYSGPVSTVTLRCIADGTTTLHLTTFSEDPHFGTSSLSPGGASIDTSVTDASVTCQGTGREAPLAPVATPTPALVLPVTGTAGLLDNR
jgi:hypothetical protein